MQLDTMRLAVRERNVLDTHDMALQVMRDFFAPWSMSMLLVIVPLMVLNYLLLGWMATSQTVEDEFFFPFRYYWAMILMIYIQAPLLSIPTVAFLGPAVFLQPVSLRQVIKDMWRALPQITICHFVIRGMALAALLPLLVDRNFGEGAPWEAIFLPMIALGSAGMRAFRPFISEIIMLERSPLSSRNPAVLSIAKRSSFLHGPSSGDLMARWMGSSLINTLLVFLMVSSAYGLMTLLFSIHSPQSPLFVHFLFPVALWSVAAYASIVRYLEYLDLRIRHEGWEVELLLRAEELRMREKVL